MRRPVFENWVRREVLRVAQTSSYSLRKLAAKAQHAKAPDELPPLLLFSAYESGRAERLLTYIWNQQLAREYGEVISKLGNRSAGKLALRGTPMMSLPLAYRSVLEAYAQAYYAPEALAAKKHELWQRSRDAQILCGATHAEVASALELDPANTSSYLKTGKVARVTMETAQRIHDHLQGLATSFHCES